MLNLAGAAAGLAGGRLAFYDRAHYDSTGLDPNFGVVQIVNTGSRVAGAGGGSVVFHDDSYARGAQLSIANKAENDGPAAGTLGGTEDFLDRSRAGQAEILNMGASSGAAGTVGGRTRFRQASNAESAVITSFGGAAFGAPGGSLQFADDASAGAATL